MSNGDVQINPINYFMQVFKKIYGLNQTKKLHAVLSANLNVSLTKLFYAVNVKNHNTILARSADNRLSTDFLVC